MTIPARPATPYSHLDVGTPEEHWRDELRQRVPADLDLDVDLLVVVAAHPDDETLGAAGLMGRAAQRGTPVIVVVASDGEASHPDSPTHTPEQLASLRRHETDRAIASVAPGSDIRFLGLPDGGLAEQADEFRVRVERIVDGAGATGAGRVLVAAPWSGDRHRDHRVAAEVVAGVCAARGLAHIGYPVWAWHWGTAADLPWERVLALRLDDAELDAKRRAIACHTTQVQPLSEHPGDEVLLHADMRSHFERDLELFIVESVAPSPPDSLDSAWFDAFYRRNGDDPWGFETRWYEERKRAVLLASLPDRTLGTVLEIGCSTGVLTRDLAGRADRVVAMDAATAAVARARDRFAAEGRVTILHGEVPGDWPDGRFDTIVFSEVGYYLSEPDLRRTIARMERSLASDGCVVACHWRHAVDAYPQTGDDVHAALRSVRTWQTLSSHVESDFVLEVFCPRPARSVAQREGLA